MPFFVESEGMAVCLILNKITPEKFKKLSKELLATFCRLLLAKCQDEFENRRRASEAFDDRDGPLSALEEEQRS
ncbi:unnamed protein product, partial [Oppiella nova]